MKNVIKILFIFIMFFSFAGTVFAKDYAERLMEKKYRKALTVGCEHVKVKNPATAAILGLLPGGGSFYTGEIGLGIADLLLWPFSPIWDAPLAYSRAKEINMEETIFSCELSKGEKL